MFSLLWKSVGGSTEMLLRRLQNFRKIFAPLAIGAILHDIEAIPGRPFY